VLCLVLDKHILLVNLDVIKREVLVICQAKLIDPDKPLNTLLACHRVFNLCCLVPSLLRLRINLVSLRRGFPNLGLGPLTKLFGLVLFIETALRLWSLQRIAKEVSLSIVTYINPVQTMPISAFVSLRGG
jgi:hypothetical protein